MKNNRVSILMDVEFKYPGYEEGSLESVYIPFPIFIEAVKKFFDRGLVTIDGTDNAIWNILVDLDCIDNLEDNKDFIEYCRELYKGSSFEEEDYEDWKDMFEFDNNLGQYAEED